MANQHHKEYPGQATAFLVISVSALLIAIYVFNDEIRGTAKELLDLTHVDLRMIPLGAAAFILFWQILDKVLFAPIINVIEEREALTSGAEVSAASAKAQTAQLENEYEEKLTGARVQGMQLKANILSDARGKAQTIVDAASAASHKEINAAREMIQKESDTLRSKLLNESDDLVDAVVEKVTSSPEPVKSQG